MHFYANLYIIGDVSYDNEFYLYIFFLRKSLNNELEF